MILLAAQEGKEPLPFDINKTPPSSPQPSVQLDVNESTNQNSNVIPKRWKRRPKQEYNFPPGTTLSEKKRGWVRTFQANMVSREEKNEKFNNVNIEL